MKAKPSYITTPIYYINARPHLGTAYTTILGDIFARYRRFFGHETFFLTGLDEHGQKALAAAEKRGLSPEAYCAEMRTSYKTAWRKLLIDIDFEPKEKSGRRSLFFHTSHRYPDKEGDRINHAKAVQRALQALYDKGDIYKGVYKGWYCVGEEIFYSEKDLINGKTPSGKEVLAIEENNYFFKMSRYQSRLLKHLEKAPQFIRPLQRQNEIKGFLKKPLQDLCLSRPKKRVSYAGGFWGVELPFDSDYVVYVWVDALLNYVNGIGYEGPKTSQSNGKPWEKRNQKDFEKWWLKGEPVHLIGKDILITHGVYWPCLLMALNLPLPKAIIAHGWLLNKEEGKMSKSQGEVLDPLRLADMFGPDALRYFLAAEIPLGRDAVVSEEIFRRKVHEDLSNTLGNLLSRLQRLVERRFEGKIPSLSEEEKHGAAPKTKEASGGGGKTAAAEHVSALHKTNESGLKSVADPDGEAEKALPFASDFPAVEEALRREIIDRAKGLIQNFEAQINSFQLNEALKEIQALLKQVNVYLEKTAPWKPAETDKKAAAVILYISLEALRISSLLLFPVMPQKTKQLLKALKAWNVIRLNEGEALSTALWKKELRWGGLKEGAEMESAPPLFPKQGRTS